MKVPTSHHVSFGPSATSANHVGAVSRIKFDGVAECRRFFARSLNKLLCSFVVRHKVLQREVADIIGDARFRQLSRCRCRISENLGAADQVTGLAIFEATCSTMFALAFRNSRARFLPSSIRRFRCFEQRSIFPS